MKWIFLFGLAAAVLPFATWLRQSPEKRALVWIVFGFLSVQHGPLHLYVAPISWPLWPGFVKGAEVSVLDGLALSILLSLPRQHRPFPLRFALGFYILALLLAVTQAQTVTPSLFYPWQTARIFFMSLVVCRAVAQDARIVSPILQGLGYGLLLALAHAVWDRVTGGVLQAAGGFQHQNQLGLITHFVALPIFAILLAGGTGWLVFIIPIAGAIIAILTASRGTIAVLFLGYAAVFALSAFRRWTPRKASVAVLTSVAAAVIIPLAVASLEARLGDQSVFETDQERQAFERAAAMMLSDHPMGVGPNHYVVVANTQGYSDRAGVLAREGSRAAHVHNAYWLVAVETGYFGLLAYGILLIQPLLTALVAGWRYWRDWRGELLLGLAVALLAVYSQSFLEWIFLSFQVQYLFGMTTGLIFGLAQSLTNRRRGTPSPKAHEHTTAHLTSDVSAAASSEFGMHFSSDNQSARKWPPR